MTEDLRSLPVGQILSDYRIERILGQGGFGITYLASDINLGRKVAIKEYYPREFAMRDGTLTIRAAGNQEDRDTFEWGRTRFLEEARILARFEHPNIVAVRRFLEANGTAYLVMDYCDGEPLDEIVKNKGPLSNEQLERILLPLLDGLERIHAANFLHRDIKPANIYIRTDGSPLLLDFGAARQETGNHSRSVTSLATSGYAAVEQYSTRGKQGPWTDIYGLGATLYRAVTGEKPQESTDRLLEDSLVPAVARAGGRYAAKFLLAIDAAMAVRPERRPQSVSKLREMIGVKSPSSAMTAPSEASRMDPSVETRPTPPRAKPAALEREIYPPGSGGPMVFLGVLAIVLATLVALNVPTSNLGVQTSSAPQPVPPTPTIPTPIPSGPPTTAAVPEPAAPARPVPVAVSLSEKDCDECPEMVVIPPGSFIMGSPATESGRYEDEGPLHRVTISRRIYVGKYEVTFKEWDVCVREKGCSHRADDLGRGRGSMPVTNVGWFDAQAYVSWLSKKTEKPYRLLSEAEWEYAARAGSQAAYAFGDSTGMLPEYAWFADNSRRQPSAVGGKPPNAFGLHDMHGNVYEWTQDCWNDNYVGAPLDGRAWLSGDCSQRVVRGGSWYSDPRYLRAAFRTGGTTSNRGDGGGFRVARTD